MTSAIRALKGQGWRQQQHETCQIFQLSHFVVALNARGNMMTGLHAVDGG
jgi:hypothetical protein